MTTLQLARAIADAVLLAATPHRKDDSTLDAPTQAVLAVLDRTGHWFMRVDKRDAAGAIVQASAKPRRKDTTLDVVGTRGGKATTERPR